ncbi:hypothetical protein AB1283_01020 [Bacillus sp. S13(2024)]|uniref:hypothetical protein n=1 Tax=Bacillus sp. S13(2024) TaxID=3162885 RepID=UPI003D2494C8
MEHLLFNNRTVAKITKANLTQKYFNKLYELIRQQSEVEVITTPMSDEEIRKSIVKIGNETEGIQYC